MRALYLIFFLTTGILLPGLQALPVWEPAISALGPSLKNYQPQQVVVLPPLEQSQLEALKAEDKVNDQKQSTDLALRIRLGIRRNLPTPIIINKDTVADSDWLVLPDGRKIYSIQITSKGAKGLSFDATNVNLPHGAFIVCYRPDGFSERVWAIKPEYIHHATYREDMSGESIVLEFQASPQVKTSDVSFRVDKIAHHYRTLSNRR